MSRCETFSPGPSSMSFLLAFTASCPSLSHCLQLMFTIRGEERPSPQSFPAVEMAHCYEKEVIRLPHNFSILLMLKFLLWRRRIVISSMAWIPASVSTTSFFPSVSSSQVLQEVKGKWMFISFWRLNSKSNVKHRFWTQSIDCDSLFGFELLF